MKKLKTELVVIDMKYRLSIEMLKAEWDDIKLKYRPSIELLIGLKVVIDLN